MRMISGTILAFVTRGDTEKRGVRISGYQDPDDPEIYVNTQAWVRGSWAEEHASIETWREGFGHTEVLNSTEAVERRGRLALYPTPSWRSVMSIAEHAADFALLHHAGQTYGHRLPYTYHLRSVADICASYGAQAQAVAWLHDVVEDTHVSLTDVLLEFNEAVMVAVSICTDPKVPAGLTNAPKEARRAAVKARANQLWARVPEPHYLGLLVKAADRLANTRASLPDEPAASPAKLAMYRAEYPEFRAAVYRPGLCDQIWAELDALLGGLAQGQARM